MTYDVIVVGGGIAGLSAAHALTHLNRKVGLFEASTRLGGRILSLHLEQGVSFEAGAHSIVGQKGHEKASHGHASAKAGHQKQNKEDESFNPLESLLTRHQIKTSPLSEVSSETFDTSGRRVNFAELQGSLSPEYHQALNLIREAKRTFHANTHGHSHAHGSTLPLLSDILKYTTDTLPKTDSPSYWARKLISATIRSHTGAEVDHVSLLELLAADLERSGGNPHIILGGADTLTDALYYEANATANLTTHMNTPVVKIQNNLIENVVSVFDEAGQNYKAETLILAVPFAILKHKKIQFAPELSQTKRNAIAHFGVSTYNTVIIEFELAFWEKDVHYLFPNGPNIEDWPQYLNGYFFSNGKCPYLIAQYAGKSARFNSATDEAILEKTLAPLKRVYGDKVSSVKFFYVSRFDSDPHIMGGSLYCSHKNKPGDFEALGKTENGLYFAGDYIYPKRHGRLEAAFEAGLQRALEVDAYLHYKHDQRHVLSSKPRP